MATNPVNPPSASDPLPDTRYDENSGIYGFFRRNQKLLLYTAGLFTLLTFSITTQMTALVSEVFRDESSMSTIVVNGKREALQAEDAERGRLLVDALRRRGQSGMSALPDGVLPELDPGAANRSELSQVYAILRRAAILEGIQASMLEVDRAIEAMRDARKEASLAKLAVDNGYTSLGEFREVVAEAMRVGTYVRLQSLALDSTAAQVMARAKADREKITLHVAAFDEKKAEEDLKKASPLAEDDLKKWLDGKDERQKRMMQAYDPPRAELRIGALLTAEGQFDAEQWKADADGKPGYLKDFTVSEEQLKSAYDSEKEARFKLEGDGQFKPADDAAVKAELTRVLQAEQVMNMLLADVRTKQNDATKAQTEGVATAQAAIKTAELLLEEATLRLEPAKADVAAKTAELKAKPDDAQLKSVVQRLESEVASLQATIDGHDAKIGPLKEALTAAEKSVETARAEFDFVAAFTELTKDKKGFVTKATPGLKSGDELKDLDALGLDLGKWAQSAQAAGLRTKGDLSFAPGRTTKAVLLYQAAAVDPLPLKPWETLKPLAEGAYWTEKAKALGEESKKKMEDSLLRLAKAKMADKVAEIEGKKQARVDEKVAAWEAEAQKAIAEAEAEVAKLLVGSNGRAKWEQFLAAKRAELAQKDQRRTGFEAEVAAAITTEIGNEAKKLHKDVLDAAAAESGFVVADHGPLVRDLQQRDPRFDKGNPAPVVFLWRGHSKLKEGESTGLVQDVAGRAYYVAVCAKVEPLSDADISRRDYELMRSGFGAADFATQQNFNMLRQSFTIEALEARYELKRAAGSLEEQAGAKQEPAGATPGASDAKK